jgi:hypothetical protein
MAEGLRFPFPLVPQQTNLPQANAAMDMTPQEQALYMRHITNLYGPGGVDNSDGSRSTLYQSVEPHNGKYYNVPTVWDGKIETQPYVKPNGEQMDVANPKALQNVAKTGWDTFPSYATPDDADARYMQMHDYMEKDTADYMRNKSSDPAMARGGLAHIPPHFAFGGATGNSPMGFGPSSFQFGNMQGGGLNPALNQSPQGGNGGWGNWGGDRGWGGQSNGDSQWSGHGLGGGWGHQMPMPPQQSFGQMPMQQQSGDQFRGLQAAPLPGAMNQFAINPGAMPMSNPMPMGGGDQRPPASAMNQMAVNPGAQQMPPPGAMNQLAANPGSMPMQPHFAAGGLASAPMPSDDPPGPQGLIHSPVAGRTDRLPMSVPADSYVIPADVVSGLGQGNTLAGSRILDALFQQQPNPAPVPSPGNGPAKGLAAGGGAPGGVPIITAGGEYMVHPEAVARIGGGDPKKGHQLLDKFVLKTRKQVIDQMKTLAGPKR